MHLFLSKNFAQRELIQYKRRVYATAINFPFIMTLVKSNPELEMNMHASLNNSKVIYKIYSSLINSNQEPKKTRRITNNFLN